MKPKLELRCPKCNTLIFKYTNGTFGNIEVMCRKCKAIIPFIRGIKQNSK